jgi:hypothetical protein
MHFLNHIGTVAHIALDKIELFPKRELNNY